MGSTSHRGRVAAIALAIASATIVAYFGLAHSGFVDYDDNGYVTENPTVRGGLTWQSIQWAFTTHEMINWHPLTWISHLIDVSLFDVNAGAHHMVSLAIHVTNAVLLLCLLYKLTAALWPSALVAALFALHPLNVESVAWISERKSLLSTFFWIVALWSYAGYARAPSIVRYLRTLALFALGLMSKPMLVTLPCTLLLFDFWPLGRTRLFGVTGPLGPVGGKQLPLAQLVLEKLPFFALTAVSCWITYTLQQEVAVVAVDIFPPLLRSVNALTSWGAYAGMLVWPRDLGVLYPLALEIRVSFALYALVFLVTVTVTVLLMRKSRPWLFVGWLWYVGTLVPVVGLVQVGSQARADRYAYVPLIGLFVMIAWTAADVARRSPRWRPLLAGCAVVWISALAFATHRQAAHWKSSLTLFAHTLSVTENNMIMHNAYGISLGRANRHEEAIAQFAEAERLGPIASSGENAVLGEILHNHANALAHLGRLEEALERCLEGLRHKPRAAEIHTSLGITLTRLERYDEALRAFEEALRLNPNYPEAHENLGLLLAKRGDTEAAIREYRIAIGLNAFHPQVWSNLGIALAKRGEVDEAMRCLQRSLELNPDNVDARTRLATVLESAGRHAEALAQRRLLPPDDLDHDMRAATELVKAGDYERAIPAFQKILAAHPDEYDVHRALGDVLFQLGRQHEATPHYTTALKGFPNDAVIHHRLGLSAQADGKLDDAIGHMKRAKELDPTRAQIAHDLARVYIDKGEMPEAELYARECVRLAPDHADASMLLAHLAGRAGRATEAAQRFRDALRVQPDSPQALLGLAELLAQSQDPRVHNPTEAVVLAQRGSDLLNGQSPEALFILAIAHATSGNMGEGIATATRALELARATQREDMIAPIEAALQQMRSSPR
ncbi:MAG: tetratricopeptide repeat protein [Planctomycetota bacterium]